jgi:PAS domain S-box-containing protein
MNYQRNTNEQLLAELTTLRRRLGELEASEIERERQEECLRETEETYKTLVETSPDAVIMADMEGRITFASDRTRQLWGSEHVEDLYGRSPFDFFAPEDHHKFEAYLEAALQEGIKRNVELTFVRRDGTRVAGETSAAVIRDSSGNPIALMGLARDITERKKAEEARRREYRVLLQMLKAQDRERQLVAYEIHDGLAQQLRGAAMQFEASEQLKDGNPQQASDCYSAGLHLLKETVAEARSLIAGLRPPILDEAGILAAIGHLIHDAMAQNGPEVKFQSSVTFKRLQPLLENAIFRIVQECLTNVCRHGKSGTAEIKLVQDGDQVRVEVQDWGVGFDPRNVREGCFGLAGIRERARVLGGKATIESEPGQGIRVVLELPVAMREVAAAKHARKQQ